MTSSKKLPFASVLQSVLDEDRQAAHPTPNRLIDYRSGWLSQEEADLVEKHLRGCQECADLFHDLEAFEEVAAPSKAELPVDRQAGAAWQRMRERLPAPPVRDSKTMRLVPVPVPPAERVQETKAAANGRSTRDGAYEPPALRAWPRSAQLMAAALLCCVVGLGIWAGSLLNKRRELSKPSANVAMIELHSDAVRGGQKPTIQAVGNHVFLILDAPDDESIAEFRAEIRKAVGGDVLVRVDGLRRMEGRTLNLLVPRSLLPPADYKVDLFREGDGPSPVASYPFTVSSP